jgi:hypothetical protein
MNMNDEGFPWTQVGRGPEPRLSPDFAARTIEKAHTTRARKRRAKLGFGATLGIAAVVATALLMRATPPNQQASLGVAPSRAIPDLYTAASSDDSDSDMLAVLMPSARYAQKFDAYYGRAAWDTYASWDPDSYDSARTR